MKKDDKKTQEKSKNIQNFNCFDDLIIQNGFDYAFNPNACEKCGGKCCTGESGYIFVSQDEIEKIAGILKISMNEFIEKYLFKVGFRYSIKEKEFFDGFACVFFENGKCGIYDARPKQCKTFPFWDYFKTHKKELEKECIGVKFFS